MGAPGSKAYTLPTIAHPGAEPIRILVADDHAVVRHGLKAILSRQPGWNVCAEGKSGPEALALANQLQPDVVVMDLNMPEMTGLEALRAIKSRSPNLGVVILTLHFSGPLVRESSRQALAATS